MWRKVLARVTLFMPICLTRHLLSQSNFHIRCGLCESVMTPWRPMLVQMLTLEKNSVFLCLNGSVEDGRWKVGLFHSKLQRKHLNFVFFFRWNFFQFSFVYFHYFYHKKYFKRMRIKSFNAWYNGWFKIWTNRKKIRIIEFYNNKTFRALNQKNLKKATKIKIYFIQIWSFEWNWLMFHQLSQTGILDFFSVSIWA